ncbi:MAG TPA: dihydrofolate reductase [Wenzhouxiangella sp.]
MMTKPSIHLVAAMTRDRVIGHQGAMPWHLPRDLKHFKEVTLGHPVVMGRKTFDSIVASLGKPLPGRLNVVISRHQPTVPEGVRVYSSLDEALSELAKTGEAIVDVIGGGQIYDLAMPMADRLYITLIDAEIEGDTWFPAIDESQWQVCDTDTHPADEANAYAMTFVTFDRVKALVDDQAN